MSRPQLLHLKTTPDLIEPLPHLADKRLSELQNLEETSSGSSNGNLDDVTKDKPDLLEMLNHRSDSYRDMKIKTDASKSSCDGYDQRVSFDTVNLQFDDDDADSDDEGYDWNYEFGPSRGRGRGRSPSPAHTSPLHSPSGAPFLTTRDSYNLSRMLSPRRLAYPTTPIITHKGCSFTKFHLDFDNLYKGKFNNKENGFLKPVLPHRVILVYISGRKHTWVALDWVLKEYIENGDTVIVVSAINKGFEKNRRKSFERQRAVAMTPRMRLRLRHRPENIKVIARNIMDYMQRVLKHGVIARLSVELSVGKTKDVLKEMYKLYEPNLVCTGSKVNSRIGAPLKSWNSSKLTDRLVKNYPLPLIVVPAMNMGRFEKKLECELNGETNITPLGFDENLIPKERDFVDDDDDDTSSISSSIDSVSSDESYSSFDEIAKLYTNYKKGLKTSLTALKKNEMNEDFFSQFLTTISDKSIEFCQNVRDVDPDFKGKGAKLARAITGSNSFGSIPYKTKSLLIPVETEQSSLSSNITSGLSYKEMKRNLQRKKLELENPSSNPSPPNIIIENASPVEPPKKSALTFNLESPPRSTSPRTTSPKSSGLRMTSKKLQKSLSHDIDSSSKRPELEPMKSHPDIRAQLGGNSRSSSSEDITGKGKKKKKFWKLF